MDTYSAAAVARILGTTTPRVIRAIGRLSSPVVKSPAGAYAITEAQLEELRGMLGDGLLIDSSRVRAKILAALARSPRGLVSIRSVARRAGVSPTAASTALPALEAAGLVRAWRCMVAQGRAQSAIVYSAAVDHPRWHEIAPALAEVSLPPLVRRRSAKVVPYYLRHLFWNTAPSQLNVDTSAPFIAKRLLCTGDLDGLSWGATHLPPEAWARAAEMRGISPRDCALATNLSRRNRAAA